MPSDVRTNRCHGRSESGGHKHFNGWGRSISRSLYRLCLAAITVPGGPESPCGGRICEDDDLRGGEGHLAGGAHGIGEEVSGVSRAPFRRLTAAFSIPSRGAGRPFCEQRDRRTWRKAWREAFAGRNFQSATEWYSEALETASDAVGHGKRCISDG